MNVFKVRREPYFGGLILVITQTLVPTSTSSVFCGFCQESHDRSDSANVSNAIGPDPLFKANSGGATR